MEILVGLYDVPKEPRIHIDAQSEFAHPIFICRGTDILTHLHIFGPDSGISSHSFGRSYNVGDVIYYFAS